MANFGNIRPPFRTVCLIVVLSIGIQVEISSGTADETPQSVIEASEASTDSQEQRGVLEDAANSTVRSLVIKGNNSFSEQQIRALMKTDVWSVYDESLLEADFEAILRFYKANGYRFARVDASQVSVKKFADGVYLGIEIDEGLIGEITLSGNEKTKKDVILRELLFEVGDVYIEADKEESEQILRDKSYIGAARIDPVWDANANTVAIHVNVTELWSPPLPSIDPALNSQGGTFLLGLRESNVFGSGHDTEVRYQRISEIGEKTKSLLTWKYRMPRVVNSHWNFDGAYIQKREGDSWAILLERPQYTLKSRWSARFTLSEAIGEFSWFEMDPLSHKLERTDRFELNLQGVSSRIRRYFGDRERQNYIGLWAASRRSKYVLLEKKFPSTADPSNRDLKLVGITVGRKRVTYHKTQFIRRMGREEVFLVGSEYAFSLGHASPLYGSDRSEGYANLIGRSGWTRGNRILSTTLVDISTYFTTRVENSTFQARTSWYYTDVFNTGDIYTVDKGFRRNGFLDFYQTFVAEFKTRLEFGWQGESQVVLGAFNGLRGYDYRQFSGEKMMVLRLESRTVCGGTLFRKLDDGIEAVATFIAKPFIKRSVNLGLIVSATAFTDIGYIWNGKHTFNLMEPKRSIGFGLRGGLAKVSNAGIFRFEFAFPLDAPSSPPFKQMIFWGIESTF